MTILLPLLALLAQAPAQPNALVSPPPSAKAPVKALVEAPVSGRGACEYSTQDTAKKKISYCTHLTSEEACKAEAARKTSAEWLQAYPPRFSPGVGCQDSDKQAKKPAAKSS
jgi:hypothetical protein